MEKYNLVQVPKVHKEKGGVFTKEKEGEKEKRKEKLFFGSGSLENLFLFCIICFEYFQYLRFSSLQLCHELRIVGTQFPINALNNGNATTL